MKYKVGDKVRVRQWEDLMSQYKVNEYGEIYFGAGFVTEMREFCGKDLEIKRVRKHGYSCKGNVWSWEDWMFEDVVEKQIDNE